MIDEIIDKGIFKKDNGIWWAWSFLRPGYCWSLRTRDEAAARAKYDKQLKQMREAFEVAGT
jgi:hypothetical protein